MINEDYGMHLFPSTAYKVWGYRTAARNAENFFKLILEAESLEKAKEIAEEGIKNIRRQLNGEEKQTQGL